MVSKFLIMSLIISTTTYLSSSQTCNILESSGTAYKDYSTFSSIEALCNGDSSTFSSWEEYQCNYIKGRNETCWPRRYFSNCAVGQLRGVGFFYHGYSACPDQYIPLINDLLDQCYHIYLPTTVGHGLNYCNVNNNTEDMCTSGYNLTELPTSRGDYITFIDSMNEVMSEEIEIIKSCELSANANFDDTSNFDVAIGGLSLGASLSGTMVERSYLYDIQWTKQVLMSPFLGISYNGADEIIYKCSLNSVNFRACLPYYFESIGFDFDFISGTGDILANLTYDLITSYVNTEFIDNSYETLNLLVREIITYMVETDDTIVTGDEYIQGLLDTTVGWGDKCVSDQHDYGRGGFCSFTVRNLAAAHSLGSYVLDNVGNSTSRGTSVNTQFIMVERDGATRNSLVAQYAQLMYNNDETTLTKNTQSCMWLISEECQSDDSRDIDNTCGVPHSSMSTKDNVGSDPYYLYWNITYNTGIIAYLTDGNIQYPDNFNIDEWDGDKIQCVSIDLNDPPSELIADVPKPFEFILNIGKQIITDAIQDAILDTIANITNVPRGILELTVGIIENIDVNSYIDGDNIITTTDDNYVLVSVDVTSDAAFTMDTLLDYGAIDEVNSYELEYASISGNDYVINDGDAMDSSSSQYIVSFCVEGIMFISIWYQYFY